MNSRYGQAEPASMLDTVTVVSKDTGTGSGAGGFGVVVGVDRVGHGPALRERGADLVITDLADLLERP